MKNVNDAKVGDLIVLPACNTKAFFIIKKLINPVLKLAIVEDIYGNKIDFDLRYVNCHKASFSEKVEYQIKKLFRNRS